MTMESTRPSGDQFLARLQAEPHARLRIYIGAAPGVGKTYTMLEDAHAFRREGVDVVVGFIEAHGRVDTEAKIGDLEVTPAADSISRRRRRRAGYGGGDPSPAAALPGR